MLALWKSSPYLFESLLLLLVVLLEVLDLALAPIEPPL